MDSFAQSMSVAKVLSTALSVVVLIAAIWYSRDDGNRFLEERLQQVLDAMLEVFNDTRPKPSKFQYST